MKNILFVASLLLGANAFADYTCYPSKKNEFATAKMTLIASNKEAHITELPNSPLELPRTGEASFSGNSQADGKSLTFDHAVYSSLKAISATGATNWFGEGYGKILVGQDLLANEPKGRAAIAWCSQWCIYDYFSCYKNKN